ncbi:hypothetical protein TSAR_008498 [Trichomalopsis sarcophagae]|uniref:Uncharacterized protein n=1 Tax=Trichomalopsis sarcophagae TaxID=543379 RepID=A0A232ET18_9HYME|nr:hypothetical protein TSAR_008498 [Trichomalopsis sarcophagae]
MEFHLRVGRYCKYNLAGTSIVRSLIAHVTTIIPVARKTYQNSVLDLGFAKGSNPLCVGNGRGQKISNKICRVKEVDILFRTEDTA